MKKRLQSIQNPALKGSLILFSYFLLAACMQHDESLAPRQNGRGADTESTEANGNGALMKSTFTAHLNSENEVNPNGVISQGQGQVIFHLSKDGTQLDYKLIVANIDSVTQAHIHCGEAGVNGSVVVFLFGFFPTGVTVNGTLAEGTITEANIIPAQDSPTCSGGLQTWEDLIARLGNGTAYVNVHTIAYPGGEIRGQVQ